ncbi:uncharacterized protein LOC116956899 isoform X1 [Petromyzon marinus]|uniref:Uncharacterized protein LOC116956899 n=1 Tax=Petromyzon marinus TaxID=7757 RepID=A0AAJ7UG83_PETMA|nr:uncharacterized protein LOC116956899 [Petromyzon marinus]XP_032834661.1 uncharacterized protein LOC116956899 [Petromyzon marinus]XP_032834662.1 uncharacterized protein LOC116956899 [Petromyzon marinus]XP_032834663.1 uncharacterized protein LOC116956899 [Petromyzon marinus]XP_032834664.1 uncharacterized protein LOC116956899 [Petromyzon marinus]
MASLKVTVMMVAVMVMKAEAQATSNAPITEFVPVTTNASLTTNNATFSPHIVTTVAQPATIAIITYTFNLTRPPGASYSDACEPDPTIIAIIAYKFNLIRPPGASYSDACEPYPTTIAIITYKFNLTRPLGASYSDACEPYPTDTTVPQNTTSSPSSALGIGVGVGVGAGALLILVITLGVCYWKRRNEPLALQKGPNASATEDRLRYMQGPGVQGQLPVPVGRPGMKLQQEVHELPGIRFQREAMKGNADEIYEELDDEGRAHKKDRCYQNFKAQVQHSPSPYECPDSQLDSDTTKPGVESPYVDLTVQ